MSVYSYINLFARVNLRYLRITQADILWQYEK